ncbi:MAG: redoxin domain-containing protein [Rhodothermales bacterium]|nr:redoxin domain-containing protein [Rhodothermales bacterium]
MKISALCIVGLLVSVSFLSGMDQVFEPLPIGSPMPLVDHAVTLTTGESTSLSQALGANGLLVVFICNTCPWVQKWEDRFNTVSSVAAGNEIGVIFLNSNEALRSTTESLAAMRQRAMDSQYNFSYAADVDNILADAFGAVRTPDVYLFDSTRTLRYRGAIDDNARNAAAATPYLIEAMRLMTENIEITSPVQKAIGCTIKRVGD